MLSVPVELPNLDVAEDEEGAVDEEVAFILVGTWDWEVQKLSTPVPLPLPFNFFFPRNKKPGVP